MEWRLIKHYVEPNWEEAGAEPQVTLFWRPSKGPTLGFIREGELFDHKCLYVCDANKVTHFAYVQEPENHKALSEDNSLQVQN